MSGTQGPRPTINLPLSVYYTGSTTISGLHSLCCMAATHVAECSRWTQRAGGIADDVRRVVCARGAANTGRRHRVPVGSETDRASSPLSTKWALHEIDHVRCIPKYNKNENHSGRGS